MDAFSWRFHIPTPFHSNNMKPAAALTHLTSNPKRTRRGHAPLRLKPLLLLSTPHPEWTTASWTHTHSHTRTNNLIYYGFNLLLWMNQGHRLALCSVQYSLSQGTTKKMLFRHVRTSPWSQRRTCKRRANKSYPYFSAWTTLSQFVCLKVSVFTSRDIRYRFPFPLWPTTFLKDWIHWHF